MEITMSSIHEDKQAIRPLSDEVFESVSGGCRSIPVSDRRAGIVFIPSTIGSKLPTGTGPTFPTDPVGPLPV
jgi:hypothetical protein